MRVVLIVLDAAETSLVEQGMDEGWMPNLGRFVSSGTSVRLFPPDESFPGAAWPTLITGTPLERHHIIRDRRLVNGSYRIADVPADALAEPPLWRYVSDHGLRSTVANLYGSPLVDNVLGTQLQGWASIDPYTSKFGRVLVDPPDTLQRLEEAVGRPAMTYEIKTPRSESDFRRYRDALLADLKIRAAAYCWLLSHTEWDFYAVSFPEIHQAGHVLWHLHDPEHPLHDTAAAPDLREALRDLYGQLDTGLGELLAAIPDDCLVFCLTPHGMGPNHLVGDPGEEVLERSGLLVLEQGLPTEVGGGLRRRVARAAWQGARSLVPESARLAMRRRLIDRPWVGSMALAGVDWQATKAFVVPPDMGSYVRLNVAGREPEGIVQPGREYDELCEEIAHTFEELVFAESGRPAVTRVLRPADIAGPEAPDGMPDLVAIWSREEPVVRVRSERLGTIDVPRDDPRTGQHRAMGYIVGAGPGIPASGRTSIDGPSALLTDVAPTALELLGVPVPGSMSGRSIGAFTGPGRKRD